MIPARSNTRFGMTLATAMTILTVAVFAVAAFANLSTHAEDPHSISFNRDIRSILSDKCFACHGFDAKKRQAELRLDTEEGAYADRNGTRAVVPRNLGASELWARIHSDDPDQVMPPPDSHKELTAAEKQMLKSWIEQGAVYQKHWSFEPPLDAKPPQFAQRRFLNPMDAFIADKLAQMNAVIGPEADARTLIRRVAFATTGLPPTSQEVAQFLGDTAPGSYDRMVDRYLDSPHYGEEMARHWLDVARYADTHGMHFDNERQTWAYRDWVIRAFNDNLRFDDFTIQQLAGDLLPTPTQDQLVATGFNRCNVTTSEGGSIDEELIFRYAVDRTSTTLQAWMGLTGGCAVCHDHKFDPISQREFYSMYAFFHSAADPAFDGNALLTNPVLKVESTGQREQLSNIDRQIQDAQRRMDNLAASIQYSDPRQTRTPATPGDIVWLDDAFPSDGKVDGNGPKAQPQFVTATDGAPVFSGKLSLKSSASGVAQNVWKEAKHPLIVPQDAVIYVHVWLESQNLPRSIMLQFHTSDWLHRAVWGDYHAIEWGKVDTYERVHMGALPIAGQWVRLEIPADKIGLKAGDALSGFAFTQADGTVYWDQFGITGRIDPTIDPAQSFLAWWSLATGKDTPGLAPEVNEAAKIGPPSNPDTFSVEKNSAVERLLWYYLQSVHTATQPQFLTDQQEITKLRESRQALEASIPGTFIFRDMPTPRDSFVMLRGAYNKKGDSVQPGVPAILPPLKLADGQNRATRLDLARWLVDPGHPLTARVTVNRLWQQFFGMGLVKTSYDFGSQGEAPSHPELLDWLALHFQRTGWDVKSLVRLLLTSDTFRQDSRASAELWGQDPHNRWYARGPRLRLEAEQIRDNALFVSGLICREMGGKGVRPYQPDNIWEPVGFAGSNTQNYKRDSGESLYRRSIYTFLKRTAPPPFMSNFDAPNREQFCTHRDRSNTPLQALQLMNDTQHIEAARGLAQRMLLEGGSTDTQHIQYGYQAVLARDANDHELEIITQQLAKHRSHYQQDAAAAEKLVSHGDSKPAAAIHPTELAAYTLVANMLLNLDETLTRN